MFLGAWSATLPQLQIALYSIQPAMPLPPQNSQYRKLKNF
jgi:hypothetical protein